MQLMALCALLAAGAVDAPFSSATVYSDRARVVRSASVSLNGPAEIELPALTDRVDPASIRVEAEGAEVRRVEILPLTADELEVDAARKLLADIEQLDARVAQVQVERAAYAEQYQKLQALRPAVVDRGPMTQPKPKLDPSGWAAAIQFSVERSAVLQAKVREREQQLEELGKERGKLAKQAALAGGAERRQGWKVVAHVAGNGKATVNLSYVTLGAVWLPRYEIQLDAAKSEVGLAFYGLVQQQSGDDWRDVGLVLSTAIPSQAVSFPKVATWKIGEKDRFIPQPVPVLVKVRPPPSVLAGKKEEANAELGRLRRELTEHFSGAAAANAREQTKTEEPYALPQGYADRAEAPPTAQMIPKPPSGSTTTSAGDVAGTVVDAESKSALPDVVVIATSPSMPGEQVVVTDSSGSYRIPNLLPGRYRLTCEKEGYKVFARSDVVVRSDATVRLNVEMRPEALNEEIVIAGKAPTIDVGSTTTGVSISSEFIKNIATASPSGRGGAARSFESLAMERPGGMNAAESDYWGVAAADHILAYQSPPPGETESVSGLMPPPGYVRPHVDPRLPAARAGGYDLAFPSVQRESIESGKGARKVALFTERWPVKLERRLYPAMTPYAYLAAEMKNPSQRVLPGGQAALFVGDDPAGAADLNVVAPGEPFTLPLGMDRSIKAVRNVTLTQSEKGFIAKDDVGEYLVTTEVANPYDAPVAVRIFDQWPLRGNDKVEVKLLSTEPWAKPDEKKGALEWDLTIQPHQTSKVAFRYSIKRPKNWRMEQRQEDQP